MSRDGYCPECQEVLQLGATSCRCGWDESSAVMKNTSKGKAIPDTTHVCSWHSTGKRCPMPAGSNTNGRWMCTGHTRSLHHHDNAIAYFDKIDELMKGHATAMHDAIIAMYRDATYWDGHGVNQVLKLDSARLAELRMRQPEWFNTCVRAVQSVVWTDLEKVTRGKISWAEFDKRQKSRGNAQ